MKPLPFLATSVVIILIAYIVFHQRDQQVEPATAPSVNVGIEEDLYPYALEEEKKPQSDSEILSITPLQIAPGQLKPVHGAEIVQEPDGAIRLRMGSAEWDCGLKVVPPKGSQHFDFSGGAYLAVDVENVSEDRQMRLTMHISSGGATSDSEDHATAILAKNRTINTGIALNPGESGTMKILLPHPHIYSFPEGALGLYLINTAGINDISFKAQWPFEKEFRWVADCKIRNIRLEGVPDTALRIPAQKYKPFVDKYGQFIHNDWTEKIRNDEEFAQDLEKELASLKPAPETWDSYGGWAAGPQLEATGHFRAEKVNDKWFLVTPDGHLFFSTGIDVTRPVVDSPNGSKHPDWYDMSIPPDGTLPFHDWNLKHKFGKEDYRTDYNNFTLQRLDSWGMNTIGNWSDTDLMASGKKPYVLTLFENHRSIPKVQGLKFYDCYDGEFESQMKAAAAERFQNNKAAAKSINDPMCIGYFIDNELQLGAAFNKMLQADFDTTPAKRAFFSMTTAAYNNDLKKLNESWGTAFTSWNELKGLTEAPKGSGFRNDRIAFETDWYNRYFRACRDAIAAISPDKMYLGSRFVGFRHADHLWQAAARYCDVITVNTYANSIFNVPEDIFANSPVERPILVGEFHFGTLERGMFRAGLCPVWDQEERARSYTRFLQGALCHPLIVGCHWFQYRDQPLVGRGDGEAYQIGFVDVCDRPYPELAEAAREVGKHMYTYRVRGFPKVEMK
jgi:hypothetical protein